MNRLFHFVFNKLRNQIFFLTQISLFCILKLYSEILYILWLWLLSQKPFDSNQASFPLNATGRRRASESFCGAATWQRAVEEDFVCAQREDWWFAYIVNHDHFLVLLLFGGFHKLGSPHVCASCWGSWLMWKLVYGALERWAWAGEGINDPPHSSWSIQLQILTNQLSVNSSF